MSAVLFMILAWAAGLFTGISIGKALKREEIREGIDLALKRDLIRVRFMEDEEVVKFPGNQPSRRDG
jgi:hypothetical protein